MYESRSLVQCSLTEPAKYPKTMVVFLDISSCVLVKVLIYIVVTAHMHPGKGDDTLCITYGVFPFCIIAFVFNVASFAPITESIENFKFHSSVI